MENYYKQKAELEIAKERLNCKLDEKEEIYVKYFGRTKDFNETIHTSNNNNNDRMMKYLIELEEKGVFNEIEDLQKEVKILKKHLKNMEVILSNLEDIEYQFLKLRYFEKKEYTLEEIALKLNYSFDYIKHISSKIEKKIRRFKR